ncbi:MAG: hypothetical protein J5699_03005 [Bacteroidales bacterium]|nr:hypothetical protein [Bacteroidales bacterium]
MRAKVDYNLEEALEKLQKIQREASSRSFEITAQRSSRAPFALVSIKVVVECDEWGRQEWTLHRKARTVDEQDSDIRFIETVANSERFMHESLRLSGELT